MRLILEGPDCAGKSTMAKELAERLQRDIIKSTYYGPNTYDDYITRLACDHVVIDRCWISELIYAKYFGRNPKIHPNTCKNLTEFCEYRHIPIVVMLPPIDVIIQRMLVRGDDFYSTVSPNIQSIYKDYEDYCAAHQSIKVIRGYHPAKLASFLRKNDI